MTCNVFGGTLNLAQSIYLDLMTLIYKLDLTIVKLYWHTRNELSV